MMQSFSFARNMYNKNMRLNDSRLECKLLDIKFPNPIGLAAGFDKFADVYPGLASLGFGSVEVGSITPKPQSGNLNHAYIVYLRIRHLLTVWVLIVRAWIEQSKTS